ncbi:MAG: RluA family pseudouridine synthase [Ruminococcaceae bacterium]|nr:RluA family pseudouridine synthase [Oscillospiraceae bacterium]
MIKLPQIAEEDVGKRLDVYLSEKGGLTRSAAQKKIESGEVLVNGESKPKKHPLSAGDEVSFAEDEPIDDINRPQEIPLEIVYEDEDLLVVNKERGIVVHPAAGNPDGTLVNALLFHCGDSLSGINGVKRPGIVHRIDKDTSGLLVVAKNDASHLSLAEQIKSHSFERQYQAVICGRMKEEQGRIEGDIGRSLKDRKKMAIVKGGRSAVTHYRVLAEYGRYSHLALQLETGRTHQIRVHLSSLGHPLVGDTLYGARDDLGLQGQCLHAKTISFRHPKSGELLHFDSELPPYFEDILNKIRNLSR